jgi:hypothetical protein
MQAPLHRVVEHRGRTPPLGSTHAAVVARDQRALGGRERHVEIPFRVLAVDTERSCQADRHLRDAHEVLDVAGQYSGVEGVAANVSKRGAAAFVDELAAPLRHLVRMVGFLRTRHLRRHRQPPQQ